MIQDLIEYQQMSMSGNIQDSQSFLLKVMNQLVEENESSGWTTWITCLDNISESQILWLKHIKIA